jgi:hypothetical protein
MGFHDGLDWKFLLRANWEPDRLLEIILATQEFLNPIPRHRNSFLGSAALPLRVGAAAHTIRA